MHPFRSQYGAPKLKYPLFEGFDRGITATDTFDQLNLRSGSHDMVLRGFYMSNRFTDDSMLDMGQINPHGRFMHNPLSPPSAPVQGRLQGPPAKSKFLAVNS